MMLVLELMTTLLLGFVLGRIWEIRQRLILAEYQRQLQRSAGRRVGNQGTERSQTTGRNPSIPAHHHKEVSAAPASALHFRSGPAAFAARLCALHQT
jgi:hypothetical protein